MYGIDHRLPAPFNIDDVIVFFLLWLYRRLLIYYAKWRNKGIDGVMDHCQRYGVIFF